MRHITDNLFIPGPVGQLEAAISCPDPQHVEAMGIVCHPHPLHQGTMQNKIVTTLARLFAEHGCPVARFNYRGVGKSEGEYDEARGEVDDALAMVTWMQENYPQTKLWLAGFSFGSFIAASAADRLTQHNSDTVAGLISIAPPVERMAFAALQHICCPWWVVQGDADEVVTPAEVYRWLEAPGPNRTRIDMPGVTHFFHGELNALYDKLHAEITPHLSNESTA